MAIDEAKKKETLQRLNKSNPNSPIKIRKDSGILEALDEACEKTSLSKSEYIRCAVEEQLTKDGFLPTEEE